VARVAPGQAVVFSVYERIKIMVRLSTLGRRCFLAYCCWLHGRSRSRGRMRRRSTASNLLRALDRRAKLLLYYCSKISEWSQADGVRVRKRRPRFLLVPASSLLSFPSLHVSSRSSRSALTTMASRAIVWLYFDPVSPWARFAYERQSLTPRRRFPANNALLPPRQSSSGTRRIGASKSNLNRSTLVV
jgi:hypothetical protein